MQTLKRPSIKSYVNSFGVAFCCLFILLLPHTGIGQSKTKLAEQETLLKTALKAKNYKDAAVRAYAIAQFYWKDKKHDKAILDLKECLEYSEKANDNTRKYLAYRDLGIIYEERKNYAKALDNFQRSLEVAQQLNHQRYQCESYIKIGRTFTNLDQFKKATEPVEEALALAIELKNIDLQLKCYELLSYYYKMLGNERKSAVYATQYATIIQGKKKEERSAKQIKELKRISEQNKKQSKEQLNQLEEKIEQAELEKKLTEAELQAKSERLKQTEDSLKLVEEISQKRQLQIDLLNKDKELAELKIKEQKASIEHEQLVRNSIIVGVLLVSALLVVTLVNHRKQVKANKKINAQNENIKKSINYAKRIQEAMLPKTDQVTLLPDHFVLFKPRDIVSGDFYWFTELKSNNGKADVAFAAVDCTGHGVPGAFMSMIGINSLNSIVNRGISEPNLILNALHMEIQAALKQEVTGNSDGMDVALCIHRKKEKKLEFSGAKNPLVYIQNNQIYHIKGDAHSIGGAKSKTDHAFQKHEIILDTPTMVYLFSDGFKDQFGGKENTRFMSKKFYNLLMDIHKLPMQEQKEMLSNTIITWMGKEKQTDDILVMGFSV